MRNTLKSLANKVTLDLVYEVVDGRAQELKNDILKVRQEVKQQAGQVNHHVDLTHEWLDQMNARLDRMDNRWDERFDRLGSQVSGDLKLLHSRLDQLFDLIGSSKTK